jgi:tripartite-type tricarboxylate transporter receptor subunit TctC
MKYLLSNKISWLSAICVGVILSSGFTQSYAKNDSYPDKPIKLDVMYSPGGATDFQARIVTMLAGGEDYLGQPIAIVNQPGAGGMTGWNDFVSNAKPNGYELAAYNAPSFIAQSIHYKDRTKFNIHNMIPIINWGADPAVLVVPKDSQFDTAKELVNYAKSNPGAITVSGAGLYTGHEIAMLQLQKAANVKFAYVPMKGGVPALQAVMSDHVKAGFNNLSDAYRNKSRLKILAIAALQRNKEFLPDVPTFKELGYDVDNTSVNYRGIMAPENTPKEIVDLLQKKFMKMFNTDKVKEKMKKGGSPMKVMKKDEVEKMWAKDEKTIKDLFGDSQ